MYDAAVCRLSSSSGRAKLLLVWFRGYFRSNEGQGESARALLTKRNSDVTGMFFKCSTGSS